MPHENRIGESIRHYRKAKDLSQDQLSNLSGVSYNAIVKLEKKDALVNPTIGTLGRIGGVLEVSISE